MSPVGNRDNSEGVSSDEYGTSSHRCIGTTSVPSDSSKEMQSLQQHILEI